MTPIAPRYLPILPGLLALVTAGGCGVGSGEAGVRVPGGSVPIIEAFSPAGEIGAAAGEVVSFSVTPREETPCSFDWSIDGGRVACAGSRLALDTSALSAGLHAVSVDVAPETGAARVASIEWKVRIASSETARR